MGLDFRSGGGEGVAFVAGATGYTGREVVPLLVRRGVRTVAHVRPASSSGDELVRRFEEVGAEVDRTPWEAAAISDTLDRLQPAAVFALLGTTKARSRAEGMGAEEGYGKVDFGLTKLVLDAAVASGSRPRFVYLSSLGVEPGTKNPYLAARASVESALRESGLPFTIARPSFVTGPDREESRPGERVGAVVADGVLGALAVLGGRRWSERYRSMTGRDLAAALVDAAFDPRTKGAVLDTADLRSRAGGSGGRGVR